MLFYQNDPVQDLRLTKDMETFKNNALEVVKNTMTVRVKDRMCFCEDPSVLTMKSQECFLLMFYPSLKCIPLHKTFLKKHSCSVVLFSLSLGE